MPALLSDDQEPIETALEDQGEVLGVAIQKCGHLTAKLQQLHLQVAGYQIAEQDHAVHHLPAGGVYRVDLMITPEAKTTDVCMPSMFLCPCPCWVGP